jgi:uncharacterized membrane protein HdeD (DUF308 family)
MNGQDEAAPQPRITPTGPTVAAGAPAPRAGPDGDAAMSALLAENWWAVAIRGVAAILFGLLALVLPGATLLSLALFFAAYLLVDGVFAIVAAVRAARREQRWGMLLAEGIVDVVMGVAVVLFPLGAVLAFVLVTAAWSLLTGALMLGAAFKLTRAHGRWWMVLSGIVSILFGAALVVAPLIGAVVLTWWLAAYAIAFGAMLLALAFKLRGRREQPAPSDAPGRPTTGTAAGGV